jgi:flagellar motor switch protein FliN/FliY
VEFAALHEPSELVTGNVTRFEFPDFHGSSTVYATPLSKAPDAAVDVQIELGRCQVSAEELDGLGAGSVVALDKGVGEPVEVFCDGRLVARGEVVELDGTFAVRITELLAGEFLANDA